MARFKKNKLVVGLDIGTTKVCACVGEIHADNAINIIAMGSSPSKGIRKGMVIHLEETIASIRCALSEVESACDYKMRSVYTGIAGPHIQGLSSHATIDVKGEEVTYADIQKAIEQAKAVSLPMDREIIHVLPQGFIIDEQEPIHEPLGMSGSKLTAHIHLVTGAASAIKNIIKSANKCSLTIQDLVLEQLASSYAILSPDEKELGVAIVDIGGGTTDIAIFYHGFIQHTSVIAIGGQHLTHDIAVGLRTPHENAEDLKKRYGCATSWLIGKDEVIEVASMGAGAKRILSRRILSDILEPRLEELFELLKKEIDQTRWRELLTCGIVLTGGSTLLPGMIEMAEQILGLPVRQGKPLPLPGLPDTMNNPIYATAVGLVLYGAHYFEHDHFKLHKRNAYNKMKQRMTEWLRDMI